MTFCFWCGIFFIPIWKRKLFWILTKFIIVIIFLPLRSIALLTWLAGWWEFETILDLSVKQSKCIKFYLLQRNYLRCNITVFSDSPSAFLPTHLYSPKSDGLNGLTINFITTLKTFSIVRDSYVPPWTYSLLWSQKLTEFGCDSRKRLLLIVDLKK